jgi:putative effector of murein hydrolase
MLCFASLGALVHWIRLCYGSDLFKSIDQFLVNFNKHTALRLTIYVILGAILAVFVTEPMTIKQAIAAGMAWPTLLGTLGTTRARIGAAEAKKGQANG